MPQFVLIFGILLAVCVARARPPAKREDNKEPFTLDEYLNGTYSNSGWNGTWISENSFLFRDGSGGNILEYNVKENTTELFLESSVLSNYSGASFTVSSNKDYLLIRYNATTIYRHSTTAQYAIYSIEDSTTLHLAEGAQLSVATWAPIGDSIVYVLNNNIYYVSEPTNVLNPFTVTNDGVPGIIYNGVPDWVYEEEVLSSGSAFWFSPNGNRIAFAWFNDTNVDNFTYYIYGKPGSLDYQYPEVVTLKYPKVGRTNPTVTLKVAQLDNPSDGLITLDIIPEEYLPDDYVLFDVTWPTNDEVSAVITNRVQNGAKIRRCNVETNSCADENEYEEYDGWLDLSAPTYSSNGEAYVLILRQPEGDDNFKHLVHSTTSKSVTRLTYGERDVTSIYGWDETNDLIYYAGSVEGYHMQTHVYSVNIKTMEDRCLTCDFIVANGENCLYAGASFSKDFSYYTKICQGRDPYYITIQNAHDEDDNFLWLDNANLRIQLAGKLMPVIKDMDIPLQSGFVAKARLLLPPNLDENDSKKYPAVVLVYAGPGTYRISDAYSLGWANYVVTSREYIYITIDGRGSARRGSNLMFQIYRKLGTVEVEDQIEVMQYLQNKLEYIDRDRTGIWGWSYGGFAAGWALAKDTDHVFKFALSVAPVTSFIYYDSIYTERYMGLPTEEDNLEGYNNTDLTRQIEAFRGRNFLLIHGNADDNVHYQQAMLLAKALEREDILFQQISYPDEAHSLSNVYPHLYHTIDRFWARSFGLADPPKSDLPKSG